MENIVENKLTIPAAFTGMDLSDLETVMLGLGEPVFRAQQLFHWVYFHRVDRFRDMDNIPHSLREFLAAHSSVRVLKKILVTGSETESTQKFLFQTPAGDFIEAVLMREGRRWTACLSTQVGCAVDCSFCATARMGFKKNLTAGEIVDQFLQLQNHTGHRITNVVFMGMGEPFLNYNRVLKAAELLTHREGVNLGARRITISTVGIVPRILQFAEEKQRYKLAISLNAPTQDQRLRIMPVSGKYPLEDVIAAAKVYYQKLRRFVTFEYVLLDGINSAPEDARNLINLLGDLPCKVNVIPYNDIGETYRCPTDTRVASFVDTLENAPFTITVRWSRGTDIKAGCGQLATGVGKNTP